MWGIYWEKLADSLFCHAALFGYLSLEFVFFVLAFLCVIYDMISIPNHVCLVHLCECGWEIYVTDIIYHASLSVILLLSGILNI